MSFLANPIYIGRIYFRGGRIKKKSVPPEQNRKDRGQKEKEGETSNNRE